MLGTTVTNRKSCPDIDTSVLKPTGLFSKYTPGLTYIVSPSRATAQAPPIVALASPSSSPLFASLPSLVT